MKVAVVGGGPAGLYAAYLIKRDDPSRDVRVYEREQRGATFGFGVVFSDRALDFLIEDDPDTHRHLALLMERWPVQKIVHRDQAVIIDGAGFAAIGRAVLLDLLYERCLGAGVELLFESEIDDPEAVGDVDLMIGADGVNSRVRTSRADQFATNQRMIGNRFVWYGTAKPFDCLSLTFRTNEHGTFCAHHYRYAPDMSTFIVECDDSAWRQAGLATMSDAESRAYCETVFAPDLDGHRLMSNKSVWRAFPLVSNAHWHTDKTVLIGDALRNAHFSIGSGTRLAMDDALALARGLRASKGDVDEALSAFEADRKPTAEKIVRASEASAAWYHAMPANMRLSAYDLAHSYMTRTGRMNDDRLATLAPDFMARYRARQTDNGS